jgi:hypothetical protein
VLNAALPSFRHGRSHTEEHYVAETLTHDVARDLILDFIAAIRAADADAARTFLAPGATITFPGPTEFDSVEDFLAWAAARYRNPVYHYSTFDLVHDGPGSTRVYAEGTFDGELLDGRRFEGVRFLDRFDFTGNVITRKLAWSDMADRLRHMG